MAMITSDVKRNSLEWLPRYMRDRHGVDMQFSVSIHSGDIVGTLHLNGQMIRGQWKHENIVNLPDRMVADIFDTWYQSVTSNVATPTPADVNLLQYLENHPELIQTEAPKKKRIRMGKWGIKKDLL